MVINTTFNGKTVKSKLFILKNTTNLYDTKHAWFACPTKWTIKDKPWDWTAECQEAFEKIKKHWCQTYFSHYNLDLGIIVASNTSSYGVGACNFHKMTDGTSKPIALTSWALLPTEKNYSQIEKEALGIIFAASTAIFTNDTSLYKQTTSHYSPSLAQKKVFLPTQPKRLQSWSTILENYNFKMEYLSLKKSGHAGGLSRLIPK